MLSYFLNQESVTQIRVETDYPALPGKWSLCRPQVWWFCKCTAPHPSQSRYEAAEMHHSPEVAFYPPQSHLCSHALYHPRECRQPSSLHVYPPCSTQQLEYSTPPVRTVYQTGSWESRLCPPTHSASLKRQLRNLKTQEDYLDWKQVCKNQANIQCKRLSFKLETETTQNKTWHLPLQCRTITVTLIISFINCRCSIGTHMPQCQCMMKWKQSHQFGREQKDWRSWGAEGVEKGLAVKHSPGCSVPEITMLCCSHAPSPRLWPVAETCCMQKYMTQL